jgi:hypothetical protein
VKVTGNPELAVALTVNVVPTFCGGIELKVMVCDCSTVKLCETEVAALYVELPAWEAVRVHVPPASREAVLPETVQMLGVDEAKLTARPEVAVAFRASEVPEVWVGMAAKVMVCDCSLGATVKLCETGVAAV